MSTTKPAEQLAEGDVVVYAHGEYKVLHVTVRRFKANVLLEGRHGSFERDIDRAKTVVVKAGA